VDKAISDPKVGKECCQQTNREVFKRGKLCLEAGILSYEDRRSTLNNHVRNTAAENEVQKHIEKLTVTSDYQGEVICVRDNGRDKRHGTVSGHAKTL